MTRQHFTRQLQQIATGFERSRAARLLPDSDPITDQEEAHEDVPATTRTARKHRTWSEEPL